jgi:hypothetical protein
MNVPLHKTQHSTSLEDDIERVLRAGVGLAAPIPPPASSAGTPAPGMWGPISPRTVSPEIASPLSLLAQVADNTARLQEQMEALVREVTGEAAPPKRLQPVPVKAAGLLPAITLLATNIEQAHVELERLILHVRRRL